MKTEDKIIRICAKCADMFGAQLIEDGKITGVYDGYVPSWMPGQLCESFKKD